MSWDDEKSVNPGEPDGELTSDEWNEHVSDQKNHASRHEDGGVDEITVTNLSGDLADPQTPKEDVTQDIVDALLVDGANIATTYDAANGELTIDTSALNEDETADRINDVISGGNNVTTTYDATEKTLTVDSPDAPVQSIFGRVGDVVAQANDYAASQIENFSSGVLDSVAGSDITPSSVTTDSVSTESAQINQQEMKPSMSEIYSEHHFKDATNSDDPLVIDGFPDVNNDTVGRHMTINLHGGHVEGSTDNTHTYVHLRIDGDDSEVYEYYRLNEGALQDITDSTFFRLGGMYNSAPLVGELTLYPNPRNGVDVIGPTAGFGSGGIGSLSEGTFLSGTYSGGSINESIEIWCGGDSGSVFADVTVYERQTVKEA